MSVKLGLLGPLQLRVDNQNVPVRRLQVRQLLAILGSETELVLTADELIEELWPMELPANPRRAFQVSMSRLRTSLGAASSILAGDIGSGFSLHPEECDVKELRTTASDIRAGAVVDLETIAKVLAMWRGQPFVDALGPARLHRARAALERDRRDMSVALAQMHIDRNDAEHAERVVTPFVEQDPSDEQAAVALGRSLAMQGRRREALERLGELRSTLRGESGLDPSSAVADLERDLLSGTELATRFARSPIKAKNDALVVGRVEERQLLLDAVERRRSVVLIGEPGIGKSTLLRIAIAAASDAGADAVSVEVSPEPTRPLAPLAELLTTVAAMHAPETEGHRAAVGRVVPELASGPTAAVARDELITDLADYLSSALQARDAILVVDDLQWADSMSAGVVEEIVGAAAVPVLMGSRPSSAPHLARLLGRATPADTYEVGPLLDDEIAAYLDARYRDSSRSRSRRRVAERSGGNPLFLSMLVDLDMDGALENEALPASVLVAVKERLDHLSAGAIETIQLAAVLGHRFSVAVLEELRPTASSDLAEASAARLISDGRFAHPLVADAAYELLPAARRVELHDRVAFQLELMGVGDVERVRHAFEAAELDPVRACATALNAGRVFATGESLQTACLWLERGLRVADVSALVDTRLGIELSLELGRAQRLLAEPAHVGTLMETAAIAESAKEYELFARTVVELASHGGTTKAGRSDEQTLALIEAALVQPIPAGMKAELKAAATTLTALSRYWARGQELYREALSALPSIDDPAVHARVLTHIHLGLSHPDDMDRRRPAIDQLEAVAEGDVDLRWEVAYLRFWEAFVTADANTASQTIETIRALTPRARHRHLSLLHVETAWAHVRGDLEAAERLLDQSLEMARTMFPESWALAHYSGLLYAIRDSQRRLGELGELVDRFMLEMPEFGNWRGPAALISAERGDLRSASAALCDLVANDFEALDRDFTWLATLSALGRVAAIVGDLSASSQLYEALAPHAGRMAWAGSCAHGTVDHVLSLLATVLGDTQGAKAHSDADIRMRARFAALR